MYLLFLQIKDVSDVSVHISKTIERAVQFAMSARGNMQSLSIMIISINLKNSLNHPVVQGNSQSQSDC